MKSFTAASQIPRPSPFELASLMMVLLLWAVEAPVWCFRRFFRLLNLLLQSHELASLAARHNVSHELVELRLLALYMTVLICVGAFTLAYLPGSELPQKQKGLLLVLFALCYGVPVVLLVSRIGDTAISGQELWDQARFFATSVLAMYAGFRLHQQTKYRRFRGKPENGATEACFLERSPSDITNRAMSSSPHDLRKKKLVPRLVARFLKKASVSMSNQDLLRSAMVTIVMLTAIFAWVLAVGTFRPWVERLNPSWWHWPKVSVILLVHVVVAFACFLGPPWTVGIRSKWGFLPVSAAWMALGLALLYLFFEERSGSHGFSADFIVGGFGVAVLFLVSLFYRYCWIRLRVWETWDPKTKEWRLPREEM
ncbi:MAG: hypothetical protein ACP5NF_11945, partial [Thermoanaerobaculum sp.]